MSQEIFVVTFAMDGLLKCEANGSFAAKNATIDIGQEYGGLEQKEGYTSWNIKGCTGENKHLLYER